ncbi:MAG: glycosyltransferase family 9 protein, partial [Muribaculaceae bacterium]|nr:glycosyltransferase family 9 protein [Muribaculaceae bacterium]
IDPPANLKVAPVDTSAYKGIGGMRRLFRELREEYGFDTFIDLHDVLRTKLLRWIAVLNGVKVSVFRKGRREKKALTGGKDKILLPLMHTTRRYAEAFHKAGIKTGEDFRIDVFANEPSLTSLYAEATPPKGVEEWWLAVAPFAAHKGKIYPLESIGKIIDHYAAQKNVKIFIFGAGEEENAKIEQLAAGRSNVVNMARKRLGLMKEAALMHDCDVMLAMDSANMHIASLVGLRTVSVWGATHPYCGFYGIGQDPADAVQLDMTCRPCSVFGNKPCRRGDYHCLNGINPQLIISRIDASPGRGDARQ